MITRGIAALIVAAAALPVPLAHAQSSRFCSVFDGRPCTPAFCSVFEDGVCIPDYGFPIGQDLRLTIETKTPPAEKPVGDINTIASLFKMLRACFVPPAEDKARASVQVSARLSFKRNGEMIAPPRWTYTTPDTPDEARKLYREAVTSSLARCAPLHFGKGMAGAVAGRPIAIRYVENRELRHGEGKP
jgi:hypothetical protein